MGSGMLLWGLLQVGCGRGRGPHGLWVSLSLTLLRDPGRPLLRAVGKPLGGLDTFSGTSRAAFGQPLGPDPRCVLMLPPPATETQKQQN